MMNIYEIWSRISSHQTTGLMYHFQFADMFYFLGLEKLGKDQDCHYHKESESLRDTHRFVLLHHNKVLIPKHVEGVDLIPGGWIRYAMGDVDRNTRKSQVTSIFDGWLEWENKTKELYTEMRKDAEDQRAIADACRIKELLLDVEDELVYIHKCINTLKMHDYSLEAMLSL